MKARMAPGIPMTTPATPRIIVWILTEADALDCGTVGGGLEFPLPEGNIPWVLGVLR